MTDAAQAADAEKPNQRKDLSTRFSSTRQPVKNGRKRDSRDKLSNDFLRALAYDFNENGAEVISSVRVLDPAKYLQIVATVVIKDTEDRVDDAPDAERIQIAIEMLNAIIDARTPKDITATVEVVNGHADD